MKQAQDRGIQARDSEVSAPESPGFGNKLRIGCKCPKPRLRSQATPEAIEQTIKPDPEKPSRKRLLPVVVLLARKGRQSRSPECPECGTALYGIGSGTQKIEEEAASLFPGARIARLDSDTPKTLAAETIKGFGTGSIDILIGTQIISKGFDFPGLTLTAVISADSLLGVQNFRADEKAMQALEQLRGRCGRRDKRGRFIIQTCRPGHPVYRQLADGSSDLLYETLLLERKEFGYPPFTRIVNVAVKDPSLQKAEDMSARLASILEQTFGNNYPEQMNIETVAGPFSPPVDRVAGYNIRIIRLTLKKDRNLHDAKRRLSATVAAFERQYRYAGHITLDVDPD